MAVPGGLLPHRRVPSVKALQEGKVRKSSNLMEPFRIHRGWCWIIDLPVRVRAARRFRDALVFRDVNVGFRASRGCKRCPAERADRASSYAR